MLTTDRELAPGPAPTSPERRPRTVAIARDRSSFALLVLLLALVLGVSVVPAHASGGEEAEFVALLNQERAAQGLPELPVASDLVAVAREHSQWMADSDTLAHNSELGSDVSGWQKVGENVGRGPSVGSIHDAFMASSGHAANILDRDWTEVGVGVVVVDGRVWVTQVFRQPDATPEPAPAPAVEDDRDDSSPEPAPSSDAEESAPAEVAPSEPEAPVGPDHTTVMLATMEAADRDASVGDLLDE